MKITLVLFVFLLTLLQPVSAEIAPILWSESIHTKPKPTTEWLNVDHYMIIKSDRTLSLDLTDHSPIKTIILRPDTNHSAYFEKKSFLFTIELSDKAKKFIDIPFGEHKFN